MLKKKIIILIFVLAVMTVVSGCGKKIIENSNNEQIVNQEQNNNQRIENQKNNEQEIRKTTTTNEEVMNYTEYEKIDTSDWLTHYSEEYGFEIKYPKKWQTEEEEQIHMGKNVKVFMLYNQYKQEPSSLFSGLFIMEGEDKIHTIKNFQDTPTLKLLNPIIIGGFKSYIAYQENNMEKWFYRYFIRTKSKNLYVYFRPSEKINKEIFYQILNTVKFDE